MKKADMGLRLFLAVASFGSGMADFTKAEPVVQSFQTLTVPLYYMPYFGLAKLLAVFGLLSPFVIKSDVFREGAQWGMLLYYVGAVATHILAGDAGNMGGAAVLSVLSLASLILFQKTRGPRVSV